MMINKENHYGRVWIVNKIAQDFILWDVWEFPIKANNSKTENFQSFCKVYWEGVNKMTTSPGITSFLFTLRNWLSKIFPFDNNINTLPIPGCRENTLKSRLSAEDLKKSKKTGSFNDNYPEIIFSPVYLFENESLFELSNNTVHALMHLGWIKKEKNYYTATMAVYIKPRGIFGALYLKLIEPFRHLIVYPAMMEMVKREWQGYISQKDKIKK